VRLSWALTIVGVLGCLQHCAGPARAQDDVAAAFAQLCPKQERRIRPHVESASARHGVPGSLLVVLMATESQCRTSVVNPRTGAVGLTQILPHGSANYPWRYSVAKLKRPGLNLMLGARHLAKWIRRCGSVAGGLAIYHGRKKCSMVDDHVRMQISLWRKTQEGRS